MSRTNSFCSVRNIAKIAILSAAAMILMFIEFPLPFAPSFYQMDFSEVPVLMGGFAMGPMAAVLIEALKITLHLLFKGSITMGVGEVANFLIGLGLALPATWLYQGHKTKAFATKGLALGTLCMTALGAILNVYVLIPAYVYLAKFPLEAILGMAKAIFGFVDSTWMMVIVCVIPFNLVKGLLVSGITLVLYKRLSTILHR